MKKSKLQFKRGIKTIHIPFMPPIGAYETHYKQIQKIKPPKGTRRIECNIMVSIDLRKGQTSYELAQVSLIK